MLRGTAGLTGGAASASDGPARTPTASRGRVRGRTSVLIAVGTTASGVLPVFLLGGLSVQVQSDLGFGGAGLGLAIGVFWLVAAATSAVSSRWLDLLGPRWGIPLALALAAVCLGGLAVATPVFAALVLWMSVGGMANALGQPSSNALLAATVARRRRALAFGIKQAAIPLATLAAGLAVPAVALTVGWRWTYGLALMIALALLVLVLAALVPRAAAPPAGQRTAGAGRRGGVDPSLRSWLRLTAIGGSLGSAAANCIGAFCVLSAVERGLAPAAAGLLLAAGSIVGAVTRIGMGALADRGVGGTLATVSLMLGIGAMGLVLMSFASPALYAVSSLVAFAGAWGWPGLQHHVVTHVAHESPAAATGVTQTGAYLGGAFGPVVFGLVVGSRGDSWAWPLCGLMAASAAALLARAHRSQP